MAGLQIKGWMIDAARLPEPLSYYRRLIDFCAGWGFNTILFRLTDDQGSAFRFASHPELVTHQHAYSAQELANLAAYAAGQGIELIPEIESFGHTGYITRSPQHADLLDADPSNHSSFTGVIPTYPATLDLLGDLFREAAAVFPSRYIHAGCDEVNWGGSHYSRSAIETRGRAAVWTEHLNALHILARSHGKELLIWADHVLGSAPDSRSILENLSREIILVDWSYWDSDPSLAQGWSSQPGPAEERARRALESGFRLVGAPAWGWCRWGVRAGEGQLRNIDAYADLYRAASAAKSTPAGIESSRCLGVIVTNWVPSRFIQGAIWDAPAYAGVALNEGAASAHLKAFQRFVEQHYGAAWDATWADLFRTLYDITPPRRGCSPGWMAPFQPLIWVDEDELASVVEMDPLPVALDLPFDRLRGQLAACAATVRLNQPDFQAFALAVEYLEHIHWRCAAVRDPQLTAASAAARIQAVAARDGELLAALEREWDRTRFPDDPAKISLLADLSPEDQTLFSMRQAAAISARLAADPQRFWKLVQK